MSIDTSDTRFQALITAIALLVLIGVYLLASISGSSTTEPAVVFQNESEGLTGYSDGTTAINSEQATENQATSAANKIRLNSPNNAMQTSLQMGGAYNGNKFENEYREDDRPVMRLTNRITPNDGVAEGYFVPQFKQKPGEDLIAVTIYVDDDFLDLVASPTIVYGWEWNNEASFNQVEVKEGLYRDTVTIKNAEQMRTDQRSQIGVTVGEKPSFNTYRIDPEDATLFILS